MGGTKVKIRRLETNDIQKIGRLVNRAMLPSLKGCPPALIKQRLALNTSDDFLLDRDITEYFVATKDKKILGVIGFNSEEIVIFYVDPKYQRQGVGLLLYGEIEKLAIKRKSPKLTVKSTIIAQSFYVSVGFTFVKKIWGVEMGRKCFTILMEKNFRSIVYNPFMEENPLSLTLVRTFDAPIQKVWDAWTTADGWDAWYGKPLEVREGSTKFNPSVGGTWKSTTIGEEGDIKFHGIFKEINAPHKLVMTMEVEGFQSDKEETVTALFKELEDGKTEMTFTQAGGNVPAEEYANGLKQGWTGFFNALEKYLSGKK